MNKRFNLRNLLNSKGFTLLEIGHRRCPTVAFGNLSLTGFTLAEVILAAAILAFVLSGLLALFISCALLNEANRNRSVAMSHAQYVMEEIKNTDFGSIQNKIENGDWDWNESEIESAGLAKIKAESIDVGVSGSDPLEVTATVIWNDRLGAGKSISLESAFTEIATSGEEEVDDDDDDDDDD